MAKNETTFTMDVTAESGEKYVGTVRIRNRLSQSQRLQLDSIRRELLGPNPLGATNDVLMSSLVIATVRTHVLEGPQWYEKSNNGLDLLDEEPLMFIFNKINEIRDGDNKAKQAEGEQAAKELKEA
jgi:hypothetical protein